MRQPTGATSLMRSGKFSCEHFAPRRPFRYSWSGSCIFNVLHPQDVKVDIGTAVRVPPGSLDQKHGKTCLRSGQEGGRKQGSEILPDWIPGMGNFVLRPYTVSESLVGRSDLASMTTISTASSNLEPGLFSLSP